MPWHQAGYEDFNVVVFLFFKKNLPCIFVHGLFYFAYLTATEKYAIACDCQDDQAVMIFQRTKTECYLESWYVSCLNKTGHFKSLDSPQF